MINKERVKLLIEALRSEKYTQTQGALRTENGYCCLGVACDIYRKKAKRGKWIPSYDNEYKFNIYKNGIEGEEEGAVLPQTVQRWFGFDSADPMLESSISATRWNDDIELNFSEIADKFEALIK